MFTFIAGIVFACVVYVCIVYWSTIAPAVAQLAVEIKDSIAAMRAKK